MLTQKRPHCACLPHSWSSSQPRSFKPTAFHTRTLIPVIGSLITITVCFPFKYQAQPSTKPHKPHTYTPSPSSAPHPLQLVHGTLTNPFQEFNRNTQSNTCMVHHQLRRLSNPLAHHQQITQNHYHDFPSCQARNHQHPSIPTGHSTHWSHLNLQHFIQRANTIH